MDLRILFIPSVTPGNGTGHLVRCLETAAEFPDMGCSVFVPEQSNAVARVLESFSTVDIVSQIDFCRYEFVVLDNRTTDATHARSLFQDCLVLGIDEGGPARAILPYLIDVFPTRKKRSPANTGGIHLIKKPGNIRTFPQRLYRILVTFGGEDPGNLALRLCQPLLRQKSVTVGQVTVVDPIAERHQRYPEGVAIVARQPALREHLADYDLIFTSFGLTAYEAVAAGTAVVLLNPSRYHDKLARKEGFPVVGILKPNRHSMTILLENPRRIQKALFPIKQRLSADVPAESTLPDLLNSIDKSANPRCPVCGGYWKRAVARFPNRTYAACDCTGIVFLILFTKGHKTYDRGYFFDEYQAQYGKTYLEDFENIKRQSKPRVKIILQLLGKKGSRSLLDVGCAYGPFLAQASAGGIDVHGIDVSADAVRYVTGTLGMKATCADFPNLEILETGGKYGAVTMWYVIEHLQNLDLALQKVNSLLPIGGIFAFSTPNLSGISGRRSKTRFLSRSPDDHFLIFSPKSARRVLRQYGFSVVSSRITGHHLERFPGERIFRGSLLRKLILLFSRVCRLGDTFEMYAVKTRANLGSR